RGGANGMWREGSVHLVTRYRFFTCRAKSFVQWNASGNTQHSWYVQLHDWSHRQRATECAEILQPDDRFSSNSAVDHDHLTASVWNCRDSIFNRVAGL